MSMKNNQINTDKVKMEEPYLSCIHKLHDDKVEINRVKISNLGHINADDHGFVYFPDFQYTPELCEDGLVHGGMKIAANFRKMLNEMPAYVNASSALAGTYAGMMKTFMPLSIPESAYDPEIEAVAKKYGMLQTGFDAMNHFCPDMSIGLELGWNGLLEKIRYYRKKNHPTDTEFYDSEEVFVIGVLEWVERLAKEAEAQAEECADEWKTANLKEIASINRRLLTEAPQTFREACQFLAHFQTLDRMFWSGGAIGYLDQLLEDYFNRDLENGVITEAEATWIIASLFFNDTHYGHIASVQSVFFTNEYRKKEILCYA